MEPSGTEGREVSLAGFLHDSRDEILADWEAALQTGQEGARFSGPQLANHVPEILDRVAEVVRSVHTGEPVALGDLPHLHALDRLDAGFDTLGAARELSLLRLIALRRWQAQVGAQLPSTALDEVRRFDAAMDEVIAGSIVARERIALKERQRALDALEHGDPFLLLDAGWRIVLMNASIEQVSRKRRSEALGRVFWEVWPEAKDPATKYWPELHRCMRERVPVQFEEYFAPLDMWTEVTVYPAGDGGIAVFLRDVSERKRAEARAREAEKALRRRERELERFFAISPDLLAVMGADGFLKRVNPAYEAVLGYSEEELLSRPYLELVHPEDREAARAEAAKVLAGEPAVRFTFRMLRQDGQARWFTVNASADPGADVFAAVGRDVTDERQQAEFEQQLIGIVSHDLRSPLTAIVAATAAMLRRGGDLDALTLRAAERIRSAADRAVALIRDLLDFTKARMPGGIALVPEPFDLHAHARAAAAEVHAGYPDRELRYEQSGEGQGVWDRDRIAQVVANLVSNAFKYGAPDRPVVLGTHASDRWVRIEVHNEGNPIDPALLPHIFEPLRQGRPTGGVGGVAGVGLGLYIVDYVVRAHGGTIEVVSTVAAGTTFVVRLPREPAPRG